MSWKSAWFNIEKLKMVADSFEGCTAQELCDKTGGRAKANGGYGINVANKLRSYGTLFEIESALKDVDDMTDNEVNEYLSRKEM